MNVKKKKTYATPTTDVVEMQSERVLCGSPLGGFGENPLFQDLPM